MLGKLLIISVKKDKSELPSTYDFEKEFWYAIWEINHLADKEHEKDDTTDRELKKSLDYLTHPKKMPSNLGGTQP